MGRVLWIAAICAATYVGLELTNEGVDGAFGGIFGASDAAVEALAERRSGPQRAGDRARRAHELDEARLSKMLED